MIYIGKEDLEAEQEAAEAAEEVRICFNSFMTEAIDLQSKSMDWFLYDIGLRHERVKMYVRSNYSTGVRDNVL